MATTPDTTWTSALLIFGVATILGVNAVLLHATNRNANGRFVRPLLRLITGRSKARLAALPDALVIESDTKAKKMSPPLIPAAQADSEVWQAARTWIKWDPNAWTRAIVHGWIEDMDVDSARRGLMGKRLTFGTSGLRGAMGAGSCRINDLVVIQTTQGLCRYLEKEGGEEFKARGVVIGRDHRKQGGLSSEGFAKLTAAVFISRGFRVFLMDGTVATPLVAFGVSYMKACAGVMVTASHNPKKDNGYKVYWGNGSQIIPPHDVGIAASVARNLEPWQTYDTKRAIAGPLCSDPTDHLAEAYFRGIAKGLCRRPEANVRSGLQVVYSAMHGVGDRWAQRAFSCFSLPPFLSVECQSEPDPEFPTVEFPNPEEQGALKEAMSLAEERGVSLVLANDPDGDRLAVAERQPSGDWHVFSGNDIGTLLGVWQWEEWRRMHPDQDASNAVMIASTVSSNMLSAVAKAEGFTFEETLPGFKWMGHRGQQLKAEGKTFLFAYEEAIGFGPGDVVFEKDGLSSAALFAEMLVALRNEDEQNWRQAGGAGSEAPTAHSAPPTLSSALLPSSSFSPGMACTSSSSSSSLSSSSSSSSCSSSLSSDNGPIGGMANARSRWNGDYINSEAATVAAPSRMFSTGGEIDNGKGGEKASPESPPPSPATVVASPPPSPLAVGHRFDHSTGTPSENCSGPPSPPFVPATLASAAASSTVVTPPPEVRGAFAGPQNESPFSSVLLRRLKALHGRYGEFAEENGYVRCEEPEVVSEIFKRLRGNGSYRSSFGSYKVTAVRDLAEGHGFDSETIDGRPSLPLVGGGAHFLTFKFAEQGVVATLRTSGTEPKIKFYLEMQGQPGIALEEVSARLSEVAAVFLDDAFELKRRGLKRTALA